MCIDRELLFITFCPRSDNKNVTNSWLSALGNRNLTAWTKFSLPPPQKHSTWHGTSPSSKASLIASKLYSSLTFTRATSSSSFLVMNWLSKTLSAPTPSASKDHHLAQGLAYQAIRIWYHLILSEHCPVQLFLALFL